MTGRPIDNERKACDAVARALERLSGRSRTDAYSPEDLGGSAQVEYVFKLGETQHAVEHTIVEAFAGQIHSNVDFAAFIEPIVATLDHQMPPPGRFDLHFDIHPTKGVKPREIATLQQSIGTWVREKAADLHAEYPEQPPRSLKPGGFRNLRRGIVAGVGLTLRRETIWSQPSIAHGRLFVTRIAPKDYETLRVDRIRKAMEKKLPKLKAWKTWARGPSWYLKAEICLSPITGSSRTQPSSSYMAGLTDRTKSGLSTLRSRPNGL